MGLLPTALSGVSSWALPYFKESLNSLVAKRMGTYLCYYQLAGKLPVSAQFQTHPVRVEC